MNDAVKPKRKYVRKEKPVIDAAGVDHKAIAKALAKLKALLPEGVADLSAVQALTVAPPAKREPTPWLEASDQKKVVKLAKNVALITNLVGDVSIRQFLAFSTAILKDGADGLASTVSELQATEGLEGLTAKHLKPFIDAGLIEFVGDDGDKRTKRIKATEKFKTEFLASLD